EPAPLLVAFALLSRCAALMARAVGRRRTRRSFAAATSVVDHARARAVAPQGLHGEAAGRQGDALEVALTLVADLLAVGGYPAVAGLRVGDRLGVFVAFDDAERVQPAAEFAVRASAACRGVELVGHVGVRDGDEVVVVRAESRAGLAVGIPLPSPEHQV